MRQKSTGRYLQTRGVCSRSLQKDSSKTFTNPLRSLLRRRNHQHGRRHEQPSRRIENIYKNYTARRRTSSLKGVPSFGPASASTTNPPSTSSKGKDDRRRRSGHCRCGVGCRQHIVMFNGSLSLLCCTGIREHDTRGRGRTWAASVDTVARTVHRELARSDSRGTRQDGQPANALRTGPRRVPQHHGQLPRPPQRV